MSYLDQIDELIIENKLDEAKELCQKHEEDKENEIKVKFRLAKILFIENKLEEAEKICKEYPNEVEMQSVLITILDKERKFEEAKAICSKYMDEIIVVKAQYVKILMKQEKYEEAEKICKDNIDNPIFILQLIKINLRQRRFQEAKRLCEENNKYPAIKAEYEEILLKEIDRKSRKKFDKYKDKKDNNKAEKDENKTPYINKIKTRIYMDDISNEFIEEVKNARFDDWKKMVALMAIYKKRKENKNAEAIYKEAKKMFKNDPIKSKKLNSLGGCITANKQKMFDWNAFDNAVRWEIDEKYADEIRTKREQEELKRQEEEERSKKELEEVAKQKEEIRKENIEENKVKEIQEEARKIEEVKADKEEKILEQKVVSNNQNSEVSIKKVKKNKNKEKEKAKEKKKDIEKQEELTMNDVYKDEIFEVKKQINIRANTSNINYIKEFNAVDNLEDKSAKDLRAKMQLVMYLRKYGKDKMAEESMPQEYEIYDLINKMLMYKRADSKYDDSEILGEILDKVSKIDGNNEYIYELIEKAYKKNGEQR